MSLQNNLSLKASQLSPQIAAFELRAAKGIYDPVLSLQVNRAFEDTPSDFQPNRLRNEGPPQRFLPVDPNSRLVDPTNVLNGVHDRYQLTTDSVGSGLTSKLPWGTLLELETRIDRRRNRTFPYPGEWFEINGNPFYPGTLYTNNYYTMSVLSLRQPLLKDFWTDADRTAILVAKQDLKISREALRAEIIAKVGQVQAAYYDLIAAKELVRSQQEALEAAKRLLTETKRMVQVGELPKLMESQAEMLVATIEADLLVSQQLYTDSENTLKNLLTDRYNEWIEVRVEPTETLLVITEKPTLVESLENALKNRPEIAEERAAVERQGYVVRYASNQRYPSLELVGSVGVNAINGGFSGLADRTFDGESSIYGAGVVLSMPLGNTKARNKYKAAQAAKAQAVLKLKATEQDISKEVHTALLAVENTLKRVTARELATKYAVQALAAEQMKLANNTSTPYMVQLLQRDLVTARAAEIRAKADYNKARAVFDQAQGLTLERNSISLNFK